MLKPALNQKGLRLKNTSFFISSHPPQKNLLKPALNQKGLRLFCYLYCERFLDSLLKPALNQKGLRHLKNGYISPFLQTFELKPALNQKGLRPLEQGNPPSSSTPNC